MKHVISDQTMVAIDIGTTKICVLIAQPRDGTSVEIIGIGKAPSEGLEKGVVVDIAKTVTSIKQAVREAELMAGYTVTSAAIGISGAHIHAYHSSGMTPIKRSVIGKSDIAQAVAAARAITIPEGQHILHVIPQYFIIDAQQKVLEPLGMYAVRLEAQVHIITGAIASVHNLISCCQQAGISVHDIVLEQLASCHAVLSPDERILGAGLLDIGGGTSDFAVYHKNILMHTKVLPIAGNHFTHDLAIGLQTTLQQAEALKKSAGWVYPTAQPTQETFDIVHADAQQTKHIASNDIFSILHPRAHELFSFIKQEIDEHFLAQYLSAGLVLTGGGSLLAGMPELARSIFNLPVRVGFPQIGKTHYPCLDNPMYATGYGLLLHMLQKQDTATIMNLQGSWTLRIVQRMKSWVSDLF